MKITVKRSEWLRGEGTYSALRRRSDSKKCCVGFAALAAGYSEEQITGLKTWNQLPNQTGHDEFVAPHTYTSQLEDDPQCGWLFAAYEVNDDIHLTDTERELFLTALFGRGGHDLEFVD